MSNVLEFYIRMKDFMSSGLVKVAKTAKQSMGEVKAAVESVSTSNKKLGDSLDSVNHKARNAGAGLGSYMRSLSSIVGVAGGLAMGVGMVNSAAKMGATQKSFEVLTGSQATGQALTGQLQGLAKDTILGPEVYKHAQTMLGFGIGVDQVLPSLKMLGDVSMGDAQKLEGLTLAFSQVQAAGRLTGQDLLQFINAGFNPLKEIADASGMSLADMKKKMEQGGISADMVTMAFQRATGQGGKFNNMMNQVGNTTYGRIAKLQGQFEEFRVKTGTFLIPLAEGIMKLSSLIMDHSEIVYGLVAAWGAYTIVTRGAIIIQALMNATMLKNPIGLLIALLAGLVIWIATSRDATVSWGQSLSDLWQVIKGLGEITGLVFSHIANTVGYYLEKATLKVWEFLENVTGSLGKVAKALGQAAVGDLGGAMATMGTPIENGATKQLGLLEGSYKQKQFENETRQIMSMAGTRESWGKFKGKGSAALGAIAGAGGGLGDMKDLLGGGGGGAAAGSNAVSGITGGGPRVITINGVKFMDKMEVHVMSGDEAVSSIQGKMEEMFLRVLNSGAYVQG